MNKCLTESDDLVERGPNTDIHHGMLGSHQDKGSDLKTDDFTTIRADKIKTEFGDIPELEHEILHAGTVDDSGRDVVVDVPSLNNDLHKELDEEGVDKGVNAQTQVESEDVLAH